MTGDYPIVCSRCYPAPRFERPCPDCGLSVYVGQFVRCGSAGVDRHDGCTPATDLGCLHDHGSPGWTCGTYSTYTNHDCRGDACRAANTEHVMAARVRRSERLTEDDPRHGRYTTYTNYDCRCEACRAASTEQNRRRRARQVEAQS